MTHIPLREQRSAQRLTLAHHHRKPTMKFILNIGLDVNATSTLAVHVVKEILVANGFMLGRERLVQSDTEPTLVIEVLPDPMAHLSPAWTISALRLIAQDLGQDCIAAYSLKTGKGVLLGPHAAKWGPFNPEFFFMLDGTRLATPAAQAA